MRSIHSVHPRVCGERRAISMPLDATNGSSPRVRGTGYRISGGMQYRRFIPACAGNGRSTGIRIVPDSVHPRVCGERLHDLLAVRQGRGSSPRVRGTVLSRFYGSIPYPVHPRVCGERQETQSDSQHCIGSSPRVRGTVPRPYYRVGYSRFIPACAGNGSDSSASSNCRYGSSPRVRGTGIPMRVPVELIRFIPACAGNGGAPGPVPGGGPVHPRVCGERGATAASAGSSAGSSPRVRGTGALRHRLPAGRRFIPACAGNGCQRARIALRPAVHPRVCGERPARSARVIR